MKSVSFQFRFFFSCSPSSTFQSQARRYRRNTALLEDRIVDQGMAGRRRHTDRIVFEHAERLMGAWPLHRAVVPRHGHGYQTHHDGAGFSCRERRVSFIVAQNLEIDLNTHNHSQLHLVGAEAERKSSESVAVWRSAYPLIEFGTHLVRCQGVE